MRKFKGNYKIMIVSVFFVAILRIGMSQKEGEKCVDKYTNTVGLCTPANQCETAQDNFEQNGIRPTFCSYSFEGAIVCCKDRSNILQTAPPQTGSEEQQHPVWGNGESKPDGRRISERKCVEYSRGVTQTVDFLPLLPDPETMSISSAKCNYIGVELIVGGQSADLGEFPHMAAIGWANDEGSYSFFCGGSLISSRFVLTAGHCTRAPNAKDPSPVIVRLRDLNINPAVDDGALPLDVPIKTIIKHPEYRPPKRYNDIALLELAASVEFDNYVRPACLWNKDSFVQKKAIATGWGVTDPSSPDTSDELQKVSLSLLDNEHCDQLLISNRNRNWQGFAPTQLCAGELRGGKDTCQGDSGAPLQLASKENQCIFHIIGVTSFGYKCAGIGKPAIYTRVSSYVDWIESVVWPGQ